MFYVSEIARTAPDTYITPLQRKVYETFVRLGIPFERVDTDEAITMEDCVEIDRKLQMNMVKTLFLCDRKQTAFYLFVTRGDKPFRAKEFSHALDVPRVSFAPADKMLELLGTKIGAATVLSALLDTAREVRIVIDRVVAASETYGCSDGTTTCYLKLNTADVLHKLLPDAGHTPDIIKV